MRTDDRSTRRSCLDLRQLVYLKCRAYLYGATFFFFFGDSVTVTQSRIKTTWPFRLIISRRLFVFLDHDSIGTVHTCLPWASDWSLIPDVVRTATIVVAWSSLRFSIILTLSKNT